MATQTFKVLVGVTGRMDSAVAAYLLKKQGMDVHAVAILFHDQGSTSTEAGLRIAKNITQYSLADLASIKKIYDQLEIPFYAVNAQDRYYALVHDPVVANRISGRFFNAKVACTCLMMQVLYEKAEVISAHYVATGHYAKLQKNQRTGESSLFSSHDNDNDQSYLLAGLTTIQLNKLMLPLSDMRKVEVQKIAQVMAIPLEASKKHQNVFEMANLGHEIADFIPPSMIKTGEIHLYYDDALMAEHTGVHNFFLSQDSSSGLDFSRTGMERDFVVVDIQPKQGQIILEDRKRFAYTHVALSNCNFGDSTNFSFPIDVYIQVKESGAKISGRLFFKNNHNCVIELSEKQEQFIPKGSVAVVYSKGTGVARVFASGVVGQYFYFDNGHAREFPNTQAQEDLELEFSIKNQMGF